MKKKLYSLTIITTLLILIINIFTKSNTLNQTITFSINLFIKNIMPSLFPMFVISSLLVEIEIPKILGNLFKKPINKLFGTKKEAAFIFFMSMITGFPSSAKYINDLLEKKQINDKDAQKILMFSFFSNPLFIINTVGTLFLKNKTIGFLILISHILGNIIIGIIFKNYNKTQNINTQKINTLTYLNTKINNTNIIETLIKSIKTSLETLINIFGIITFTLIITNTLIQTKNNITIPLIGIIEMTTGLKYISISNINYTIKIILSMFIISFGGFSVHLQIMSILKEKKVKYLPFLLSRILHSIISVIILIILIILII